MKVLREIMDYYNRLHLLDCNYSQILRKNKYPPECVRINNYLILPNSKEIIFLRRLFCNNNTGNLDYLKLYTLLENTPVEAEISRDQEDWFNSLEKELIQVQEDLNFYDNILGEFTTEDIISLGLDSRGDTIQESSVVMTTTDAAMTADINVGAVIMDDVGVVNDSCA